MVIPPLKAFAKCHMDQSRELTGAFSWIDMGAELGKGTLNNKDVPF